jgi:hypothetical protein
MGQITPAYLHLAALAFLTRLFQFHLGLLCVAPLLASLIMRCYRLAAAAAILLLSAGPDIWDAIPRSPPGRGSAAHTIALHECGFRRSRRPRDPARIKPGALTWL